MIEGKSKGYGVMNDIDSLSMSKQQIITICGDLRYKRTITRTILQIVDIRFRSMEGHIRTIRGELIDMCVGMWEGDIRCQKITD